MSTKTQKFKAELEAEKLFEVRFIERMKNTNVYAFRQSYHTLYSDVIIPIITEKNLSEKELKKQRDEFAKEITQQRVMIHELHKTLKIALEYIQNHRAPTAPDEAYESLIEAISDYFEQ